MNENKWTECGLNADWVAQAWHYGTHQPNCVDGDYYVIDNEDGSFSVYRYYPSREEETNELKGTWVTKRDAMAFVERGGGWGKLVNKLSSQEIPDFFNELKGESA